MEVRTLNIDAFHKVCGELSFKIDFQPDLIIGILNGGGFVLDNLISNDKFSSVTNKNFKLSRGSRFRNFYVIQLILRWLPYSVLNKLRELESKKAKNTIDQLDSMDVSSHLTDVDFHNLTSKKVKNILIVDDAIDTGRTMFVISQKLKNAFPEAKIKVAVISWTLDNSIVKPDYYIFKDILVRFPWSKDYKGEKIEK